MPRIHPVFIVIAAILVQVFILFAAKKKIAHSEVLIYATFFSIALTSLSAYIAFKSTSENKPFRALVVSALKPTGTGMVYGGIFAALCAVLFYLTTDVVVDINVLHSEILLKIFLLALPAVVEEIIFRGLLLGFLCRALRRFGSNSLIVANVFQALVFSIAHFNTMQFQEHLYPVSVFIFGIALGYWAIKQKSLWFSMGFHVAWNCSNYFLFGIHQRLLAHEPGLFVGFLHDAHFIGISLLMFALALGSFLLVGVVHHRR